MQIYDSALMEHLVLAKNQKLPFKVYCSKNPLLLVVGSKLLVPQNDTNSQHRKATLL